MEYVAKQNSQEEENGGPEKKLMKPWENMQAPPSLLVKSELLKCFHLDVELPPPMVKPSSREAPVAKALPKVTEPSLGSFQNPYHTKIWDALDLVLGRTQILGRRDTNKIYTAQSQRTSEDQGCTNRESGRAAWACDRQGPTQRTRAWLRRARGSHTLTSFPGALSPGGRLARGGKWAEGFS